MKYIYQLLIVLFCAVSFVGCGDEDFLEIDSLNADGDEFFCNQKVKVWLCVKSSDLWHTDYQWSCDGGVLTQPQGLNEMTWKAPSLPGTYTITCKATIGGQSQVRSHKMIVSSYYFEKFEKSLHSLSFQNCTTNLKKEGSNQYMQFSVNSSAEVTRYLRRAFGDETLHTPFSIRMKFGFEKNVPNTQQVAIGSKKGNGVLESRFNLRSNVANKGNFVNQIRVLFYPSIPIDGYPAVPVGETVVEGSTDFNVQVIVQQTDAAGKKNTFNEYHKLNTLNTFKAKSYKNISFAVDENENLLVYMDGVEALNSNLIKKVRTDKACEGHIFIDNWEFYTLNGNSGRDIPVMYLDDIYGSNTEVLK